MAATTTLLTESTPLPLKHDTRSRTRSPHRERKVREKYWSYRYVNPAGQLNADHADVHPLFDGQGFHTSATDCSEQFQSKWATAQPNKKDLYLQAQLWPRPPRQHRSRKDYWIDKRRNHHTDNSIAVLVADSCPAIAGASRKTGRTSNRRTRCNAPLDCPSRSSSHGWGEDTGGLWDTSGLPFAVNGLDVDLGDPLLREENAEAWIEIDDMARREKAEKKHVDALVEAAELQFVARQNAAIQKMEDDGWDVVRDCESDFELV